MKYITLILMLLVPAVCSAWTLNWTCNGEIDLAGYKVYISTPLAPSNFSFLAETTVCCYELDVAHENHYFAVSAFDEAGNESGLSPAILFDIPEPPDTTPPANPSEPWINENVCDADITMDGNVNFVDYLTFWRSWYIEKGRTDCIRPLVLDSRG